MYVFLELLGTLFINTLYVRCFNGLTRHSLIAWCLVQILYLYIIKVFGFFPQFFFLLFKPDVVFCRLNFSFTLNLGHYISWSNIRFRPIVFFMVWGGGVVENGRSKSNQSVMVLRAHT